MPAEAGDAGVLPPVSPLLESNEASADEAGSDPESADVLQQVLMCLRQKLSRLIPILLTCLRQLLTRVPQPPQDCQRPPDPLPGFLISLIRRANDPQSSHVLDQRPHAKPPGLLLFLPAR